MTRAKVLFIALTAVSALVFAGSIAGVFVLQKSKSQPGRYDLKAIVLGTSGLLLLTLLAMVGLAIGIAKLSG